jgi:hypothetical protein
MKANGVRQTVVVSFNIVTSLILSILLLTMKKKKTDENSK